LVFDADIGVPIGSVRRRSGGDFIAVGRGGFPFGTFASFEAAARALRCGPLRHRVDGIMLA